MIDFENVIKLLKLRNKQIICFYSLYSQYVAKSIIHYLIENANIVTELIYENKKLINKNSISIMDELNKIDYIIVINPLNSLNTGYDKNLYNILKEYEKKQYYIIYLDWPQPDYWGKYFRKIKYIYNKAIFKVDYNKLNEINSKIIEKLNKGKIIHLSDNNGTDLYIKINKPIISENGVFNSTNNIIQLPSGEVFFPINNSDECEGRVSIKVKGQYELFEIKNGKIDLTRLDNKFGFCEVCEFGIGTNYNVPLIRKLPFIEKALGSFHLGFGDNTSFYGEIVNDYHFDITFYPYKLELDSVETDLYDNLQEEI